MSYWNRRLFCGLVIAALTLLQFVPALLSAEELGYRVNDPDLKVVRLDSSDDDSFLSVRLDTAGRIFVGGRKTLFVYDLDDATLKKWQAIARNTAWKDYAEHNENCAKLMKLAEKTL